jgi:osmotically-inducible protein OsmY
LIRLVACAALLACAAALADDAPKAPPSQFQLADDLSLALDVANALRTAGIGGVQIEARSGRVVLKGKPGGAAAIARALETAKGVPGVREIENRLQAD